uniref:Uncharacterized protein n=1 Tax=Alexandrium monilatum TaxID=311494 RepID=A0A7S4QZK3_9DINO
MVQEAPYRVQFEHEGPAVYDGLYVRNTFLDCDSPHAPKLPVLERGRTAPATVTLPEAREGRALEASGSRARRGRRRHHHAAAVAPELRQVGDEPCSLEDKTHPEHDDLLAANGDAGRPSLSPVPPSPVELVRMRTFDPFEDSASEMPGRDGQAEGVGIPRVKTFDPLEEQWLMDQGGPWAYHPGNFEVPPYMMMPAMPAAPGEWLPADGPHLVPCHDRLGGGFAQPAFEALAQAAPAAQAVSGLTGSACPLTSSLDTLTAPPRPTAVFQGPEGFGSSGGSPPSAPAAAAVAAAAPAAASSSAPAAPPQPQSLERGFSASGSGVYRVSWTVDARKLSGSERVAVSPPFELSCPTPMTFKMMILPKANSDRRGGASFRKSGGRGIVQVKCEAQTNEFSGGVLTFRIAAGKNLEDAKRKPPRRVVKHNFTKSLVCALQDEHEEWDFRQMVDEASQTFAVCLELV